MLKHLFLLIFSILLVSNSWSAFISTNEQTTNPNTGVLLSTHGLCTVTALNTNQGLLYLTSAHCVGSCSAAGQFNFHNNFQGSIHFKNGFLGNVTRVYASNNGLCNLYNINVEKDYAILRVQPFNVNMLAPNGFGTAQQNCAANTILKGTPGNLWHRHLLNGVLPVVRVQQKNSNQWEYNDARFQINYINGNQIIMANRIQGEKGQSGGPLINQNQELCGILSRGNDNAISYYVPVNTILTDILNNNLQQNNVNAPNNPNIVFFAAD